MLLGRLHDFFEDAQALFLAFSHVEFRPQHGQLSLMHLFERGIAVFVGLSREFGHGLDDGGPFFEQLLELVIRWLLSVQGKGAAKGDAH